MEKTEQETRTEQEIEQIIEFLNSEPDIGDDLDFYENFICGSHEQFIS
jgi:hypothetical protein